MYIHDHIAGVISYGIINMAGNIHQKAIDDECRVGGLALSALSQVYQGQHVKWDRRLDHSIITKWEIDNGMLVDNLERIKTPQSPPLLLNRYSIKSSCSPSKIKSGYLSLSPLLTSMLPHHIQWYWHHFRRLYKQWLLGPLHSPIEDQIPSLVIHSGGPTVGLTGTPRT